MGTETSLADILNDEPETEVAEQPETIGQSRDESGRFASKDETVETPDAVEQPESVTTTPEQEPAHIPVAALKSERTKRQQAEQERQQALEQLQQYEQYFAQMQQQPAQEFDPETQAFIELVRDQVKAQVMQEVQQAGQQFGTVQRAEVSEMLARQKYADYDEKVEIFRQAAQENPFLIAELQRQADPATYAYQTAQRYTEAKQYGSAPSRDEIKAQLREELMAELGMSNRQQAPTSLANARSVGSRSSGPAWAGPTPLRDILS